MRFILLLLLSPVFLSAFLVNPSRENSTTLSSESTTQEERIFVSSGIELIDIGSVNNGNTSGSGEERKEI
jgi:hypothetical protein